MQYEFEYKQGESTKIAKKEQQDDGDSWKRNGIWFDFVCIYAII